MPDSDSVFLFSAGDFDKALRALSVNLVHGGKNLFQDWKGEYSNPGTRLRLAMRLEAEGLAVALDPALGARGDMILTQLGDRVVQEAGGYEIWKKAQERKARRARRMACLTHLWQGLTVLAAFCSLIISGMAYRDQAHEHTQLRDVLAERNLLRTKVNQLNDALKATRPAPEKTPRKQTSTRGKG